MSLCHTLCVLTPIHALRCITKLQRPAQPMSLPPSYRHAVPQTEAPSPTRAIPARCAMTPEVLTLGMPGYLPRPACTPCAWSPYPGVRGVQDLRAYVASSRLVSRMKIERTAHGDGLGSAAAPGADTPAKSWPSAKGFLQTRVVARRG